MRTALKARRRLAWAEGVLGEWERVVETRRRELAEAEARERAPAGDDDEEEADDEAD